MTRLHPVLKYANSFPFFGPNGHFPGRMGPDG